MEVRQVVVSVADVLRAPYSGAERLTQVLLGENVKIEESYGQWFFVRAADGYHGWLTANSMGLYFTPGLAELALFIRPRVIVQPVEGQLNEPCIVYCGTCLAVCGVMPPFIKVILPSGGYGWVLESCVKRYTQANGIPRADRDQLLKLGKRFLGTPYLWGGITAAGVDCSGLAFVLYRACGMQIPRDAHEQFLRGKTVFAPNKGDLVFFSAAGTSLFPTHVGIFLGEDLFLHASSSFGGVVISSLQDSFYKERYLGARSLF
ncbi:MAG: NlpC/P60 family protein [bacterium]|jgi:hypothetical protein